MQGKLETERVFAAFAATATGQRKVRGPPLKPHAVENAAKNETKVVFSVTPHTTPNFLFFYFLFFLELL